MMNYIRPSVVIRRTHTAASPSSDDPQLLLLLLLLPPPPLGSRAAQSASSDGLEQLIYLIQPHTQRTKSDDRLQHLRSYRIVLPTESQITNCILSLISPTV